MSWSIDVGSPMFTRSHRSLYALVADNFFRMTRIIRRIVFGKVFIKMEALSGVN